MSGVQVNKLSDIKARDRLIQHYEKEKENLQNENFNNNTKSQDLQILSLRADNEQLSAQVQQLK